jgi:hypothetical protein
MDASDDVVGIPPKWPDCIDDVTEDRRKSARRSQSGSERHFARSPCEVGSVRTNFDLVRAASTDAQFPASTTRSPSW